MAITWVTVGRFVRSRGLRGEIVVGETSGLGSSLSYVGRVFTQDLAYALEVESRRWVAGQWVLKFKGVDSLEQAEIYRSQCVVVERSSLKPGCYWADIEGASVLDCATKKTVGTLIRSETVELAGNVSHENWVIQTEYGEVMIPAAGGFVQKVDAHQRMVWIQNWKEFV